MFTSPCWSSGKFCSTAPKRFFSCEKYFKKMKSRTLKCSSACPPGGGALSDRVPTETCERTFFSFLNCNLVIQWPILHTGGILWCSIHLSSRAVAPVVFSWNGWLLKTGWCRARHLSFTFITSDFKSKGNSGEVGGDVFRPTFF